ncbi:hypothetical protein [Nitrospira sp. BLG_1]|uniref:hypothetical protein n=1 Tax=Nitrospira sp. BLG_1 TaxID=3395883 RepID=UPI0039BD5F60
MSKFNDSKIGRVELLAAIEKLNTTYTKTPTGKALEAVLDVAIKGVMVLPKGGVNCDMVVKLIGAYIDAGGRITFDDTNIKKDDKASSEPKCSCGRFGCESLERKSKGESNEGSAD